MTALSAFRRSGCVPSMFIADFPRRVDACAPREQHRRLSTTREGTCANASRSKTFLLRPHQVVSGADDTAEVRL